MGAYLGANAINIFGGQTTGGATINNQDKSVTPSESSQSITADAGYTGLGTVTVDAISSTYVGSGIDRRDTTDLSASGATVSVPSGYYENNASTSVSSGTAGTPTATKGAVSDHSISVTPSVTNTSGYITGSTITGTPVTVSASELVSGSETKTANGTYDVTNLASLVVNVSGGGGDTWTWMGKNPTKIATLVDLKEFLKDTSFASWTPSTTEKTIKSVGTLTSQTLDLTNYDYRIWTYFHAHFEYNEGTSGTAMPTDTYQTMCYFIFSYPDNLSDITADTTNKASCDNHSIIRGGIFYKNTSGVDTYATGSQGFYLKNPGSLTYSMTSVTPKRPSINVKCSTTYFSTANCALVNQNTSYYEMKVELWRVDKYTIPESVLYRTIRDMWVNGF